MFGYYFVTQVIIDNPVFGPPTFKEDALSWDEYLIDRHRRNIKKMNYSYEELITLGDSAVIDWNTAMDYYFDAKTVFPKRILARRGLCYVMLKQCQTNRNFCNYAKREIYYAAQHVSDRDIVNKIYIDDLVDLTGLNEIVELEEGEALSSIF